MSIDITATTTNVSSSATTECYSCHQTVVQAEAYTVGLLETVVRDGREVLHITEKTAEVCENCVFDEEE